MSENYSPATGAEPQASYATAFFSQRDLGLQVPINYVTAPSVSLTAACFSQKRFEDRSTVKCLSNLLAVGFRRFELDLYWDQGREVWSFCPASVTNAVARTQSMLQLTSNSSSMTSHTSNPVTSLSLLTSSGVIAARATTDSTSIHSTSATQIAGAAGTSSSGTLLPTSSSLPGTPNDPLVTIGPFVCTSTIGVSTFTSTLLSFIEGTQTLLGTNLLSVILNIHAVSSNSAPTDSPLTPGNLPGTDDLLGNMFASNLSTYMYTPNYLFSDRVNLDESWYRDIVPQQFRPTMDYYNVTYNKYGAASTSDGWPSGTSIEFQQSKRLLLGWGNVDPQMSEYNFGGDSGTVFEGGYLQTEETGLAASNTGVVTAGCLLHIQDTDLASLNSSWALGSSLAGFSYPVTASSSLTPLLNLTSNITNCGISSLLNVSLLGSTADQNYVPYQNYSYAAGLWSWASGEPRNYSSSEDASSKSLFSCAVTNSNLGGRWTVSDCSQKYYAACRAFGKPYNWTVTTYTTSYSYADDACIDGYGFAAPRTALENSYLTQTIRESKRDYDGHGIWVDFNDLDLPGCWTTGGSNATCPYKDDVGVSDDIRKRVILIPTVAAFIVLLITVLTIASKAVGNHRVSKRSRTRASNGFVYEGVPS